MLSKEKLKRIIGHLPKWITHPDANRVPFLNKAARVMWPHLNRAISNSVVGSVEPLLNRLVEASKVKLHFSKFTLGIEPPVLVSVKAVDEVPNEIGLDIEFKWAAADPEVQLDVAIMGVKVPVALEKLEAFGCVRVVFGSLCDWWPTFSDMQVAFIGRPEVNFNIQVIGGDITKVPYVEQLLNRLIKNVLVNLMAWPNKLNIKITEDLGRKRTNSSGIMRIVVRRACNLRSPNVVRKRMSPVVELKIRDGDYDKPIVKHLTAAGVGHDPVYEEEFEVRLHDVRGAQIAICVVNSSASLKSTSFKTEIGNDGDSDSQEIGSPREGRHKIDKEKSLKKTISNVLGHASYEVGGLLAKPNEIVEEILPLKCGKGVRYMDYITRGYTGSPEIAISTQFLPFADETVESPVNTDGLTLDDLLAGDDLEKFCGVLHLKLLCGDAMVARDDNGRSDPFVIFAMGKQKHRSSTKFKTLNPVWDEDYDFIVNHSMLELDQNLRCEVWDLDANGYKEYMGVAYFNIKEIIGELILIGGPGAVLKRVEELQETPSGRLHVEFTFSSVSENMDRVEKVVEHLAEEEVSESIANGFKPGGYRRLDAMTKKLRARDRAKELMAGMTTSSDGKRRKDKPSLMDIAMDKNDDEDDCRGLDRDSSRIKEKGGCFGGLFGHRDGTGKFRARQNQRAPAGLRESGEGEVPGVVSLPASEVCETGRASPAA